MPGMSTLIQNRQPPGRPTGGQYAATEHAESGVTLGQPAAIPAPPRPAAVYGPERPWQYDVDRGLYWDGEHEATPIEVSEPATRTMARRALSCPRLPKDKARLVVMHAMPGRRFSERDDCYKVVGPTSGQPLVVRVDSGLHMFEVESGNVRIEIAHSWGGSVRATGGAVDVVVEGTNKQHIEFTDEATGSVRLSDECRGRVVTRSSGPVHVYGGGDRQVWAYPGSDLHRHDQPATPIGAAS